MSCPLIGQRGSGWYSKWPVFTHHYFSKKKSPAVKTYKRLLISEARRKRGSKRERKREK